MFCNEWGGFFSSVRQPIISYGGLTVSGGGSVTVRAAALQRTVRLHVGVRVSSSAIGLIALIQRTIPETSAVGRLFSSLVHLALKMKLNTRCRQVQAASDGALLFISFIEQPYAALPYVAVSMNGNVYYHSIKVVLIHFFGLVLRWTLSRINRLKSQ